MANNNKVKTVKLYKDQDYCIVNEGSGEEGKLRDLGYAEKEVSTIEPGLSVDPENIEESNLDEVRVDTDQIDSENTARDEEISEDNEEKEEQE